MELFDPFKSLSFPEEQCFISGRAADIRIPVFPDWLQEMFSLEEKPFKLLNEEMTVFGALKVPCNSQIYQEYLRPLESIVEIAFFKGYEGLNALPALTIFQWFSKILYGLVYAELQVAFREHEKGTAGSDEPLGISPSLLERFKNLHLLLQSVMIPFSFEDFEPFTLIILQVADNTSARELDYRDDMSTMVFSLAFGDAGILIALHDSGQNRLFHARLLQLLEGRELNQLQFREVTARLFYSAYLFDPIPYYLVLPPTAAAPYFSVTAQLIQGAASRPVFRPWEDKVFAQVLQEFWKPWNLTKSEILDSKGKTLTFLNESGKLLQDPGPETRVYV